MEKKVSVEDEKFIPETVVDKLRPNAPVMTKTRDGRSIEVTRRVFTLASHPDNPSIQKTVTGSVYQRQADGSLRSMNPQGLPKRERSKLKKELKRRSEHGYQFNIANRTGERTEGRVQGMPEGAGVQPVVQEERGE